MSEEFAHEFQKWIDANWLRIQDQLSACVVQLCYVSHLEDPAGPDRSIPNLHPSMNYASGFVVWLEGSLIWVTAGHVLRQYLRVEEELSGLKLSTARLVYGFHRLSQTHELESRVILINKQAILAIDEEGIDVGAVPIPAPLARELLQAGVKSIPLERTSEEAERFWLYAAIGIPDSGQLRETIDEPGRRAFKSYGAVPMLPIGEEPEPPPELKASVNGFYGRVLSAEGAVDGREEVLEQLSGMSGSIIFGLQPLEPLDRGDMRVRPVAILTHATTREPFHVGGPYLRPFLTGLVKGARGEL
jgi:hypothetical protein